MINPGTCPLCGELNNCAMADANQDDEQPCWCKSETFPQALLDKVPAAEEHRACICSNCLKLHTDQA